MNTTTIKRTAEKVGEIRRIMGFLNEFDKEEIIASGNCISESTHFIREMWSNLLDKKHKSLSCGGFGFSLTKVGNLKIVPDFYFIVKHESEKYDTTR